MTILFPVSTELSLLQYTPRPLLLKAQPWLPSSLTLIQHFCEVSICSIPLAWSQFLLFSHSQNILLRQNINLLHLCCSFEWMKMYWMEFLSTYDFLPWLKRKDRQEKYSTIFSLHSIPTPLPRPRPLFLAMNEIVLDFSQQFGGRYACLYLK